MNFVKYALYKFFRISLFEKASSIHRKLLTGWVNVLHVSNIFAY